MGAGISQAGKYAIVPSQYEHGFAATYETTTQTPKASCCSIFRTGALVTGGAIGMLAATFATTILLSTPLSALVAAGLAITVAAMPVIGLALLAGGALLFLACALTALIVSICKNPRSSSPAPAHPDTDTDQDNDDKDGYDAPTVDEFGFGSS